MTAANDSVRALLVITISVCLVVFCLWALAATLRFCVRVVSGNRPTLGSCVAILLVGVLASIPVGTVFRLLEMRANADAGAAVVGLHLIAGFFVQSAIIAALARDHRGRLATFWQAGGANLMHTALIAGSISVLAVGLYAAFPRQTSEVFQVAQDRGWRELSASMAAATPDRAQRAAVRKHPALGVQASPFNLEFLRRHARYRSENPAYFRDPAWPMRLADEVAASGF